MKVEDCLRVLPDSSVDAFAKCLRVETPSANRGYHIRVIADTLTHWTSFEQKVFRYLTQDQMDSLVEAVYTGFAPPNLEQFEKYGLYFSGRMPTDIRQMLQKHLSHRLLQAFPDRGDSVHTGLYLRIFLFVNLLRSFGDKVNLRNSRFRAECARYDLGPHDTMRIKKFLERRGIIVIEGNVCHLIDAKWKEWTGLDQWEQFLSVYEQGVPNEIPLFRIVSEYQPSLDQWVDVSYFNDAASTISRQKLHQIGLMEFIEEGDRHYGRLTQDGWYFAKQRTPGVWSEKVVIVSTDFEVFVPHQFDPLVISKLMNHGQVRHVDYFIVLGLDPFHHVNVELVELLEKHAMAVPDVLRYSLTHS